MFFECVNALVLDAIACDGGGVVFTVVEMTKHANEKRKTKITG